MEINELASLLDNAAKNAEAIDQLSSQHEFSEEQAYAIQAASLQKRYTRGEKYIGLKMGFTSKAKMEQMGVHDLIWGRLTDAMLIPNNGKLFLQKYIHPRAEPEICFLIKKRIDKAISLEEAPLYVEAVATAIEIIDSRYKNFKFSLQDVIADNCSSTGLILGDWQNPNQTINDLKISLEVDGETVQSGSSNAILGNPWESLVHAARLAQKYKQEIPEGAYIMAGAATPAIYLKGNQHISATIQSLGTASFVTE